VSAIAAVAVPLMVLAGLATHFNARASLARQSSDAAANPQAAMMRTLMLWVFPIGVLIGGPFLMIAILLYWVANNLWTYGQQYFVFARLDREDRKREVLSQERTAERPSNESREVATEPKPGARPINSKKKPNRGGK